jgi:ubiquinone/menaquinone biosynthesis C-methylase UbiE
MNTSRQTYITEIYSKYWINAREKRYGFLEYDKSLIDHINKYLKKEHQILEVAVGTGKPFVEYFYNDGCRNISGIDISPILIEKAKSLFPAVNFKIGDAEDLPFGDKLFDIVFCFHSTWYFSDILKAIDEMIRVTRVNGHLFFDIINSKFKNDSIITKMQNSNKCLEYLIHFIKNILKILVGRKDISWKIVKYFEATDPNILNDFLDMKRIQYCVFVRNNDDSIIKVNLSKAIESYSRLIYSIQL